MNALNEDETSSSTGTVMETKRKESFKDKSRRQSRADIRNLTDASSTNSSGYISISNRSVVDVFHFFLLIFNCSQVRILYI